MKRRPVRIERRGSRHEIRGPRSGWNSENPGKKTRPDRLSGRTAPGNCAGRWRRPGRGHSERQFGQHDGRTAFIAADFDDNACGRSGCRKEAKKTGFVFTEMARNVAGVSPRVVDDSLQVGGQIRIGQSLGSMRGKRSFPGKNETGRAAWSRGL